MKYKIAASTVLLIGLIYGSIAADHAIEGFWATYDIRAVERTSWAEFEAYKAAKAEAAEQATKHATSPAPVKKAKATGKVSMLPPPPKPAALAQLDPIGAYLRR